MKATGCSVILDGNKGFTLPSDIGELGDDITKLDLSRCSLIGAFGMSTHTARARSQSEPFFRTI